MSGRHTPGPWQGGDGVQTTRLWSHIPGGSVIVADFSVSKSLRHEEQVANCRRAKASARVVEGYSTEEVERLNARGITLDAIRTEVAKLLVDLRHDKAFASFNERTGALRRLFWDEKQEPTR